MSPNETFQALSTFWSSFGVPAFEENTVPDEEDRPSFPYITYEVNFGEFDNSVSLSASIFDRSTSWERTVTLASAIDRRIKDGGLFLGGGIWLKKGDPFMQSMSDDNDKMIRRLIINVNAEFNNK